MLTEERHRIIRNRLAAQGRVIATELAAEFGVSEDTARRDLRELARAGACRRVYGGALPAAPDNGPAPVRGTIAVQEKAGLARAAVRLIAEGETVFIDAGTTNTAIAAAIPEELSLTVATNSLAVATALARRPRIRLLLLGGGYDGSLDACLGGDTVDAIRRLRADLCFLGACGLDAVAGVTANHSGEAEVKRAMVAVSRRVAVAATNDKLGTAAPFAVVPAATLGDLVIGAGTAADAAGAFAALGITLHRA